MSMLKGASVDVSLLITNPNSTGKLEATEITCKICKKSDGSVLVEDTLKREISIPPNGSADVAVPLKVGLFGMGSSGKSILVRGATEVIVSGEVTFNAPMAETGPLKLSYQREIDIEFSSQ
jgi:hypothetical protein